MSSETTTTPSRSPAARPRHAQQNGGGSVNRTNGSASSGVAWRQLKPGALTRRLRERLKSSKHPEWDWRRQKLAQHDTDPGGGGGSPGGLQGLGLSGLGCLNGFPAEPEPLAELSPPADAATAAVTVAEVHSAPTGGRADTLPRGRAAKQREDEPTRGAPNVPTLVRSNSTGTNCSITSSDYGFQVKRFEQFQPVAMLCQKNLPFQSNQL